MKHFRSLSAWLMPALLALIALTTYDARFQTSAIVLFCTAAAVWSAPSVFGLRFDYRCLGTAPSNVYVDGSVAYGSQAVTINSIVYWLKSLTIKDGSHKILQKDFIGRPTGKVLIDEEITGSAVLQLPTATTALPAKYKTFTVIRQGSVSQSFLIESVGDKYESEGETMCDITVSEALASRTYT